MDIPEFFPNKLLKKLSCQDAILVPLSRCIGAPERSVLTVNDLHKLYLYLGQGLYFIHNNNKYRVNSRVVCFPTGNVHKLCTFKNKFQTCTLALFHSGGLIVIAPREFRGSGYFDGKSGLIETNWEITCFKI